MNLTYDVRQIELNTMAPEDEIHFVCKCNSTTKYSALLHASKHTHTHTPGDCRSIAQIYLT